MGEQISFDEALNRIAAAAQSLGSERVAIDRAGDRVLARDLHARIDSPQRPLSAMDGFAVRDDDARTGVSLEIVATYFRGDALPPAIEPGQTVALFTGSPVPANADRVVMQEDVSRTASTIRIERVPGLSRHIRAAGSDFARGTLLLPRGVHLSYRQMVIAAAADMADIDVVRRPQLAILSTGDELVAPGAAVGHPERTPESITLGLAALAREWGAEIASRQIVGDCQRTIRNAAAAACLSADCLVLVGGASIGERDYAREAVSGPDWSNGFAGVRMKPGKPVWFGRSGACHVLGLAGNPTAAMITARLFLAPLIAGLSGRDWREAACWRREEFAAPTPSSPFDFFARARRTGAELVLLDAQQASIQRNLAQAELLVRIRPERAPGDVIELLDF